MKKTFISALGIALLSVLLCAASMQAQAYSIINTQSFYVTDGIEFNFIMQDWSTSDPSPNPCVSSTPLFTACIITMGISSGGANPTIAYSGGRWPMPARRPPSSMGALLQDLKNIGFSIPYFGSIHIPEKSFNRNLCISVIYTLAGEGLSSDDLYMKPCVVVTPPPRKCTFSGNSTIDHKTLSENALDGAKASTVVNLRCQGEGGGWMDSVTVSTSRSDWYGVKLRPDASLYSKITVNGKDANVGVDVPIRNGLISELNITSTLITRGVVEPGPFSGSTVLTVSWP